MRRALPERPLQRLLVSAAERHRPDDCLYEGRFAVLCATGIDPSELADCIEIQLGEFCYKQNPLGTAAVREAPARLSAPTNPIL